MAINISKSILFPVRRDGQIPTTITSLGGSSVGSTIGGGSSLAGVAWSGDTLVISGNVYVSGDTRAYGDVMAYSSEDAPINWWDNLPSELNSILGTGLTMSNNLLYTTGGGGGSDASLSSIVSTETSNRVSGDNTLSTGISNEISNRIGGDSSLATSISGKQTQLNGTGFIKANGTTISYDNSTYLTSINSGQVTGALGFTPYNSTNPSGYITSSDLSPYATLANSFKQVTYQDLNAGHTDFSNAKYGLTHVNTPTGDFGYYQSYGTGSYGGQTFIDYSGNDYLYYRGISNGSPRAWKQLAPIASPNFTGKIALGNQEDILSTNGITLGSDSSSIEFIGSNWGTGYGSKIYSVDAADGVSLRIAGRNYSTSWTDAVTIKTNGGYVGIGTDAPQTKLEVNIGSAGDGIMLSSPAGTGWRNAIAWNHSKGSGVVSARIATVDDGNYGGHLVFENRTGIGTATTERMRISTDGNVVIGGTSASDTRLTVKGVDNTASNYGLAVKDSNANNIFLVRNDGMVSLSGTLTLGSWNTKRLTLTGLGGDTGCIKWYIRLHPDSASTIGSLRVTIHDSYNYCPTGGFLTAEFTYRNSNSGFINEPDFRVTSTTGNAWQFCRIGAVEIENGYVSIPVWCYNNNTLQALIEWYDVSDIIRDRITVTTAVQSTLPAANYQSIQGDLQVSGNIYAGGEVTAYYSSDERLKKNIKPFKALDTISKLKPVEYNWNDTAVSLNSKKDTERKNYGLIAQEVETILPELINGIYDDKYKSIDYIQLVPILIQAVKEQQQQIKYLKSDLDYVLKNFHK